jgi:hypothetical protein
MSADCFPPVEVTFAPAWWRAKYGMDFGESAWLDPIRRTELDRERRRRLYERFGEVGLGEADPPPRPNIEAYGHRFMAALYGCEIRYLPDQDPAALAVPGAAGRMASLRAPDLAESSVVRQAFAEAKILRERYGSCDGSINIGGPLNNAVSVFGEEILSACLADPPLAWRTLQVMAETVLAVYDGVMCAINGQEVTTPRPGWGIGNCPVCMISPETYRAVALPVDRWLRGQFRDFGLHHCGVFHPYAEVYAELQPTGLDVGWGSDLRRVREVFPSTPMSLMVEASALAGKGERELDALVTQTAGAAAPLEFVTKLWVAEIGPGTSDETVRSLVTAPARIQHA